MFFTCISTYLSILKDIIGLGKGRYFRVVTATWSKNILPRFLCQAGAVSPPPIGIMGSALLKGGVPQC